MHDADCIRLRFRSNAKRMSCESAATIRKLPVGFAASVAMSPGQSAPLLPFARRNPMKTLHFHFRKISMALLPAFLLLGAPEDAAESSAEPGWETAAPRDEIRPEFSYDPAGGPDRTGSFAIRSDQREGLIGHWMKPFPIAGGQHYRFSALCKVDGSQS